MEMPSVNVGDNAAQDAPGDDQTARWEAFEAAMEAVRDHNEEPARGADSSGDDSGNDDAGAGTSSAAAGAGEPSDGELLAIEKKEAKKLGKAAYKRWKRLQKAQGGGKSKSKSKSKSKISKKEANKPKEKKEKPNKEKKEKKPAKRPREDDEDGFGGLGGSDDDEDPSAINEAQFLAATQAAQARGRRLESGAQRILKQSSARKGLTPQQRHQKAEETAQELVAKMKDAHRRDELALSSGGADKAPPLNRVAIKDEVQSACARQSLIGPLVEAGLLGELSGWLYDLRRGEPAPFELRSTALDILLKVPVAGEVAAAKEDRHGGIDLSQFHGLSREELQPTTLGGAVNALRLHQHETSSNRSKCVRLLERLSSAFSGRAVTASADAGHLGVVSWKCKNDQSVRSPFDVVQTGSQSFQQAFMKPDPQDPTSYNNLLPWRPPPRSITNLSGSIGK